MAGLIDLNGLGHFKAKENAMVADTYSASKTYAVGDYVYYNGTLYRCTTAISTTEAWTAGHWTAVKLADDCSSLKTAITQKAIPIINTTSGNPAHFTDGADDIPIKELVLNIVATQDGSGTPSPTNPRSINNYSQVNVTLSEDGTDGTTYTVSFSSVGTTGTVSGGVLNLTTGELTVTHLKRTITSLSGSKPDYYNYLGGNALPDKNAPIDIICDKMNTATSRGATGVYINTNSSIIFKTSSYDTAAALMEAFGGTVDVVYKLATPREYTLTPTEIKTLLGSNYISGDSGSVSVKYVADTKLYIDGAINALLESISGEDGEQWG